MEFTAADWSLNLAGLLPDGSKAPLNTKGQLVIDQGRGLRTGGTGFAAATEASVYLLPPVVSTKSSQLRAGRAIVPLEAPLLLGKVLVGGDGSFVGTLPVPTTVPPGDYISQVVGYSPSMQVRTASLGVVLSADKKAVVKRVTTTVYFASGSPVLDARDKAKLSAAAKRIPKTATNVNVQSIGYVQGTTYTGNDLKLSTARAVNAAAHLKRGGVRGKSYVSGRGVAKESGATARRVEVVIAYTLTR
jgi:flagellar motor protein MotB